MNERRLGIIMNGVTGRMGRNQHLERSVLAIMREGGLPLADGSRVMPDPILVGRDEGRVAALARAYGIARWTADLDAALADPDDRLFFDTAHTGGRAERLERAVAAGKDVYCEKPAATDLAGALAAWRAARDAGVRHGVVQDKLWMPGVRKLRLLLDAGFFGRILSVRGEFGYWVFEGDLQPAQRPSWNYRAEEGGGIILDMLCHWRYLVDNTFGPIRAVSCRGATHIPRRRDENGAEYEATADDAAYATFELDDGVVVQFNSSWCVRVRRDDLLTLQVDGTHGSAVAGLRRCFTQSRVNTPKPVWNPDLPPAVDYAAGWSEVPDTMDYPNAFRAQWERFIRHLHGEASFPWDLREGAKGLQLAELGLASWAERRWRDVEDLEA